MFRVEELPETCRVYWHNKFGKLVRLLALLKRNAVISYLRRPKRTEKYGKPEEADILNQL
jgi:hypothetical protein